MSTHGAFLIQNAEDVRRIRSLYKKEDDSDDIATLRQWVVQHPDVYKGFSDQLLENTIIYSKGNIDKAKYRLERYCALRSSLTKFFDKYDVKREFDDLHCVANIVILPQLTKDYKRVVFVTNRNGMKPSTLSDSYKFILIVLEYIKAHDYNDGLSFIIDYSEFNIWELVPKIRPIEMTQMARLVMEGYGLKLSGLHIISKSRWISVIVNILKGVLSRKLGERIQVHKDYKTLYEVVPREILPLEYGGNEISMKMLYEKWLNELSSQEHVDYLKHMDNVFKTAIDNDLQ